MSNFRCSLKDYGYYDISEVGQKGFRIEAPVKTLEPGEFPGNKKVRTVAWFARVGGASLTAENALMSAKYEDNVGNPVENQPEDIFLGVKDQEVNHGMAICLLYLRMYGASRAHHTHQHHHQILVTRYKNMYYAVAQHVQSGVFVVWAKGFKPEIAAQRCWSKLKHDEFVLFTPKRGEVNRETA